MKICIIAWERPLECGSSATHVWEIANNLADAGVEVHMILPQMDVPDSQINLHIIKQSSGFIPNRIKFLLSTISLLVISDRINCNLLYTRSLLNALALIPIRWFYGKKLVIEANCIWSDEQTRYIKGPRKYVLYNFLKFVELFVANNMDGIISVTPAIKEYFEENGIDDKRIFVVENGANTDLFKPSNQGDCKIKLGLSRTHRYICFVGNLAPWQGVEYIIQSAPMILDEYPNAKFLIVGNGIARDSLELLAQELGVRDKFTFTGAVPYENVPLYINASDICVAYKKPLLSGYSPLKLYEYMACSKPIVSSRVNGFEILEENNCGILIEPENFEELAKGVIFLMGNIPLAKKMGLNGRSFVTSNRDWRNIAKEIAEICASIIR